MNDARPRSLEPTTKNKSINHHTNLVKPNLNTLRLLDNEISNLNNIEFDTLGAISNALHTKQSNKIQSLANKALNLPLSYQSKQPKLESEFIPRAKKSTSSKANLELKPNTDFIPAIAKQHPIKIPEIEYKFDMDFDLQWL